MENWQAVPHTLTASPIELREEREGEVDRIE